MNMSLCDFVPKNWTMGLYVNLKNENGPPILFYFYNYVLKFNHILNMEYLKNIVVIYYRLDKCINLK